MNLILLPGNSPENKGWIDELAKLFRPNFETVWVQYWQHWQEEKPVIDLEKELERLVKTNGPLRLSLRENTFREKLN